MTSEDRIFNDSLEEIGDFRFDGSVANVFNDMVERSVPFYKEMQRMMGEIAADFAPPGTRLYDLGCSTGTTLLNMDQQLEPTVGFVGVDKSEDMLTLCDKHLTAAGVSRDYRLIQADLNQGIALDNASVVTLCLTLQFIRPLYRTRLIKQIYDQLLPSGCLLLVEKVLGEDSIFNRLFIKYYYDYKKRNGYTDLSISQKREALENVLIPYKLDENLDMLAEVGFKNIEVFFKWHNFAGIVAVK